MSILNYESFEKIICVVIRARNLEDRPHFIYLKIKCDTLDQTLNITKGFCDETKETDLVLQI